MGYKNERYQFSVTTNVFFSTLTREQIIYYIDTYKPYDKAGSYGIQEWIGQVGIKKIQGSYTNVMGLPMYETYQAIVAMSKKWLN
jgi:septum formation protein